MRTLAALLLAFQASADTPALTWRVAPRAAWVQEAPTRAAQAVLAPGLLLHDRQIRITAEGDDRYEHTLRRVAAAQTAERSAEIDVAVDPRFQELVIHSLRVTHPDGSGGTLAAAQIRDQTSSQPVEAEPRKRALNPRLQISIQVPGVRPGDLIECEYTVQSHPTRVAGMFIGHYAAQWSSGDEPVRWERLHVIWPVARPLQFRLSGASLHAPERMQSQPGELDLLWRDLASVPPEPDTPRWFDSRSTVQLSDFGDWTRVGALLAPQYGPYDPVPELRRKNPVQPTALAAPALILDTLRRVQQRGGGDSRELAHLLVSQLREAGIDAQVALADSRGAPLDTRLPSPYILDAAVVVARAGKTEYWLNPAAPGSAVALGTTDPADLRSALLISAAGGKVVALPPPAPDSRLRSVLQHFDLRNGRTLPGALTLTTRYQGSGAQAVHDNLLAQSPAQRQLNQIQSVAQDYPSAIPDGEVQLQNLPDQQAVEVTARFHLPQPFGDPQDPQFGFFAEALAEVAQPRDESTRRLPLGLPWPLQLEQHIDALLPPDFVVSPGKVVIENRAFRYQREVRFAQGRLRIDHRYVALADHVDPGDYPKFLQANAQVYQALGLRVRSAGSFWRRVLDWLGLR